MAAACRWPKADWVFHLIPLLTGKARSAYVHMDVDETHNYDDVKTAILKKYDINPETYRQRFRSLYVYPDESPKELYVRLKELYGKWILPRGKTVEEIGEMLIMEQFLRMLSPELQVWIKEHDPKSAAEASTLADVFVAARRKGQPWSNASFKDKNACKPASSRHHQGSATGGSKISRIELPANFPNKFSKRLPVCYLCGQEGHTKPVCPQNPLKLTQMCLVPSQDSDIKERGSLTRMTLVHRQFIPSGVHTYDTISICCVHGEERPYPTADIFIEVGGQAYLLKVVVADALPFPVILGEDLPVLNDLLKPAKDCNVAITRAKAAEVNEHLPTLSTLPFFDADVETDPGRSRKSRNQRKQEKFRGPVHPWERKCDC
ncbi:uncharacterized protein LOC118564770 [Fundulus heteroclitus]|uniref:uncharacterized protein LOC118564770 n=1 Tax=Fundulus heteroclitus TaxID=8078 RepID=UPI00165C5ABB|nr:uncharacterized protein LOC118564770 [Fundulus heteroclitus]